MKAAKKKSSNASRKDSSTKTKPDTKKKVKEKDKKVSGKKGDKKKKTQEKPAKPEPKKKKKKSDPKKETTASPKSAAKKTTTKTSKSKATGSAAKKAIAQPDPKKKASAKPTAPKPTKVSKPRSATPPKAKAKAKTAVPRKKAAKKTAVARKPTRTLPDIPAILLEGDEPRYSGPSGPGSRYASGDSERPGAADHDLALPEAYGTKRIHLVARDPQWVYAHWDLTLEQMRTYNQLARNGHLTLQIFEGAISGQAKTQIDVHPESRSWFAHVGKGGGDYFAVLGFHDKLGDWQQIAVSEKASTPPDSLSDDLEATFTSIPVTIPFKELIKVVREYAANEPKLARALNLIQQTNIPETAGFSFAVDRPGAAPKWSKAQQQALADAVSMDEVRRTWIGSEEVLELIKGREALSSEAAIPTSGISSISSVSSPFGGEQPSGARGFWFNVNAELIIYGATEPDATVTIGERKIKLRNDGTFSYRFALPDGQYQLPIAATSADEVETRNANLEFARTTEYRGDVGQHPQDTQLKKPSSENVD